MRLRDGRRDPNQLKIRKQNHRQQGHRRKNKWHSANREQGRQRRICHRDWRRSCHQRLETLMARTSPVPMTNSSLTALLTVGTVPFVLSPVALLSVILFTDF